MKAVELKSVKSSRRPTRNYTTSLDNTFLKEVTKGKFIYCKQLNLALKTMTVTIALDDFAKGLLLVTKLTEIIGVFYLRRT